LLLSLLVEAKEVLQSIMQEHGLQARSFPEIGDQHQVFLSGSHAPAWEPEIEQPTNLCIE